MSTVAGHRSPGVGVESPFELLAACHDRVRRTLDLLERLQAHVVDKGCDDDARSAARDVLRYFDIAAPLHHQDEELHVFPPLLAGPDTSLHSLVRRLQADHVQMETLWISARTVLQGIAEASAAGLGPLQPAQTQSLKDFAALYGQHMQDEEQRVYPGALALLSEPQRQAMGQEMGARRGSMGT